MHIPDKAIEAALNQYSLLLDGAGIAGKGEEEREGLREEVNALLKLAAPHIVAYALRALADSEQKSSDEFARELGVYEDDDPIPAAVMVSTLRACADSLESPDA